ncbi:MAG: hypothetical protein QOI35_857 [Cryptosporangiaceae bacterium]|nr:hypothetical protein [Cryptosporangiaceae bacterium]MDQ1658153.1 hypothetical protein [Cryptosporangiaceae bacterium]
MDGSATPFFQHGPAVGLDALRGAGGARSGWLRGACLGALGRYGSARRELQDLLADPGHGSLAASTLASHLRQLGRHTEARDLDERALAQPVRPGGAEGLDAPGDALFDARLGLAADSVGALDPAAAAQWLDEAAAVPGEHWRRAVRIGWVRTEIALLCGESQRAAEAARIALSAAQDASAPRHVAKCQLFLGAALDAAGDPQAGPVLAAAAAGSAKLGTEPLRWVAESLLAARARRSGDTRGSALHQHASRSALTAIAADLPAYDRETFLNRPDISAIVSAIA